MKRIILLAAVLCCAVTPALAQDPAAPSMPVYEIGDVETQPVPANLDEFRAALASRYPEEKQAAGQGARVSVAFVLTPEGVPSDLRVASSTDPAFDSATVAAMALLRFTPATVGGRAVPVRVEVPVEWKPAPPAEGSAPALAADAVPAGSADAPARPRVYALSEVTQHPRPSNLNVLREELVRLYPVALREAQIGGLVQLNLVVTEQGEVEDVLVTRTSDVRFNAAAVQAVAVLRFHPARLNGQPVRTRVDLPIQWHVQGPPPPRRDDCDPYRLRRPARCP